MFMSSKDIAIIMQKFFYASDPFLSCYMQLLMSSLICNGKYQTGDPLVSSITFLYTSVVELN